MPLTSLHTFVVLSGAFHRDLARLIYSYFVAKSASSKRLALAGNYEACVRIAKNVDRMLKGACVGGYIAIVEYAIVRGWSKWDDGLEWACRGGDAEIIAKMIACGATEYGMGLMGACRGGHMTIARDMLARNVHPQEITYSMFHAGRSGRTEIIDLLVAQGTSSRAYAIDGACRGGHIEIVKRMLNPGVDTSYYFSSACRSSNIDIVKLLLPHTSVQDYELESACRTGNSAIVDLLIESGAKNWDYGLYGACAGGHLELAKRMITLGAKTWIWGLSAACSREQVETAALMVVHGANYCNNCNSSIDHAPKFEFSDM